MSHEPALPTEPKAPAARVPAPAADAAPDYHGTLATLVVITLERHIMRKQAKFSYATGELSQLVRDLALAGKMEFSLQRGEKLR